MQETPLRKPGGWNQHGTTQPRSAAASPKSTPAPAEWVQRAKSPPTTSAISWRTPTGVALAAARISARDSATSGQSASGYRCHEAANAAAQTSTSSAERAKCAVLQSSESNGKGQVAPAPPGKRGEGQCRLAR